MRTLIVAASLLVSTSIVGAQPRPLEEPSPRSARHAVALAAAGTAASIALTGLGLTLELGNHGGGYGPTTDFIGMMALFGGPISLVATPSLGHKYGEDRWSTPGAYVRVGGLAIIGGGLVVDLADNLHGLFCIPSEGPCPDDNHRGLVIAGAGAALMLGGAVYDIATSASATDRYNAEHGLRLHLVPTALRTPSNTTIGGIGLAGTF